MAPVRFELSDVPSPLYSSLPRLKGAPDTTGQIEPSS
jgi:hypothetical protein